MASVAALSVTVIAGLIAAWPADAVVIAPHNPNGSLDSLTDTAGVVTYRGWAADPDVPGTVRIVVMVDGRATSTVLANQTRTDIGKAYPAFGSQRGYSGTLRLNPGTHQVCIVAGDLAAGSDTTFGCAKLAGSRTAQTGGTAKPFAFLDSVSYRSGKLSVSGWAIDPDSTSPILMDVMINGDSYGSALASLSRPDVARVYPRYGPDHGYSYTMTAPLSPGNYDICPVAINNAVGGNTILNCKIITSLPSSPPATMNLGTATSAAKAMQAQAIASGAATAANFTGANSAAAQIAIAARALLQQATGRHAAPRPVAGRPSFKVATPALAVDEQLVMGPTPNLGTYPAARTGGRSGSAHSLEAFRNDSLTPPNAAGDGVVGAAAILPPNGTTVEPRLPGYPAGAYTRLRAEVAVDAALSHLGDSYVWAASGPTTFDCSGLTEAAWASAGVSLYHYTVTQSTQGVRVRPNQLLPGDLVLFGSDLHHVGMYLGAGYMIDAPYTGAYVRVDSISSFGDFTLAVRP